MTIRERLVALARSYAGVSVTDARQRYLDLVGPGEAPDMRAYMALPKTSGCALTVRGFWRLLGLVHRRLAPPYVFGMAVTDCVQIGRNSSAYVSPPELDRLPEPGDMVLVGGDRLKDGGVEHVYTVIEVELVGREVHIVSIDGGQVDASGNQCIREKRRTWTRDTRGAFWDQVEQGSDPGARARRRVMGFVNVSKLPFPEPPSEWTGACA